MKRRDIDEETEKLLLQLCDMAIKYSDGQVRATLQNMLNKVVVVEDPLPNIPKES